MSCKFVNVMALTLSAAEELENPILMELLKDYAKSKATNKLQYFLIHLLAKKHTEKIGDENRAMYNVIKRYLRLNTANITKDLIWAS